MKKNRFFENSREEHLIDEVMKFGAIYWYQIFYTNDIHIIWVVRITWVLFFKSSYT